ncbi:MAG: HINT domain-containing protein, partial [Planctomycetaceae bacterium]|nr:HINT domain-containing protein [Planctomycetaceae bacterium]
MGFIFESTKQKSETNNPDLSRAAREVVDENGTILYHENLGITEHGYWVEAKDLRAGDVFLDANGELSSLVSTERVEFPEGITVYNFTVDGNHDYFVIAQEYEFG